MEVELNQASVNGFVLGLLVAEEMAGSLLDSKSNQETALISLILDVAEGKRSFSPSDSRLLALFPASADTLFTRDAMRQTALSLVEWYQRTLFPK